MTVFSLIIPVYGNAETLPELLKVLTGLNEDLGKQLEVVFVVDGSPDDSASILRQHLPDVPFRAQLIELSRNFGAFAAVRTGLEAASGSVFAVMAADLQEPPELIREFFEILTHEPVDIVVGTRESRSDPFVRRIASRLFWAFYRRFVQRDMPRGGADVFGCNKTVRDRVLALRESNSSLIGLLFWVGFRRRTVAYHRLPRASGKSGWTLSRRVRYMTDSIFGFTDRPVRLLVSVGVFGLAFSSIASVVIFIARLVGAVTVPGYAATALFVTFLTALNSFGLGIIGSYVWRAFENTKGRPHAIVMSAETFGEDGS